MRIRSVEIRGIVGDNGIVPVPCVLGKAGIDLRLQGGTLALQCRRDDKVKNEVRMLRPPDHPQIVQREARINGMQRLGKKRTNLLQLRVIGHHRVIVNCQVDVMPLTKNGKIDRKCLMEEYRKSMQNRVKS